MDINFKFLDSAHRIRYTTNIRKVLIWKASYLATLEGDLKERYENILADLAEWEKIEAIHGEGAVLDFENETVRLLYQNPSHHRNYPTRHFENALRYQGLNPTEL